MRKHLLIRFIVLVLALLGVTSGALSNEETAQTLIASGHPEWPPVMFKKGKNIIGAGPELVRKIFGELGIKVKIPYSGPWEKVLSQAKAGQIDVVVAAYKTKERENYFVYSYPYTTDPVAVFVPADKTFKFSTLSDLAGKSGIGMIGDSYGQKFDDYSATHLKLRRVQTVAEGFNRIAHHQADYFLYSHSSVKLEHKKNQRSLIVPLPKLVSAQYFYVMISKKS
ncbi:MAG: transporter substrate-binding domain-containing protein, partial [Deltaproteobacteria bacterium]|nr:transporter substrate-binding domain-containing protein [Deltaproteobacteria bacterium]